MLTGTPASAAVRSAVYAAPVERSGEGTTESYTGAATHPGFQKGASGDRFHHVDLARDGPGDEHPATLFENLDLPCPKLNKIAQRSVLLLGHGNHLVLLVERRQRNNEITQGADVEMALDGAHRHRLDLPSRRLGIDNDLQELRTQPRSAPDDKHIHAVASNRPVRNDRCCARLTSANYEHISGPKDGLRMTGIAFRADACEVILRDDPWANVEAPDEREPFLHVER